MGEAHKGILVARDWVLQDYLAAIVECSDDAIIGKDLNGTIRSWNRGAERIFGYTAEEAVGRHISMLATPERAGEIPEILHRISHGERVDHYQTKRMAKDGRVLSISLSVSPIRNAAGEVVGASKIARDITDQERDQQALRDANQRLTRANHDLEQFAYSASHDLQEPLRMVSIYAEMLQRRLADQLGPSGDQYLRYILAGATRMDLLLQGLRTYTQASTSDIAPDRKVDANEALRRALTGLTAALDGSGASITNDPLPWVRMHDFQLEQVFQNLVGNAIRYHSTTPPIIHIAAEWSDLEWRFSVRDNGIGIDPQYKEEIFGLFKRLHSAAQYPGTGIGLAICQRIVERAGGRIWVESEPGRGSIFYFTVPDDRRNQG